MISTLYVRPLSKTSGRQRGAVTLLVVAVLVLIVSMVAISTTRTSAVELQITGNDMRAREVQEAAQAGLEQGLVWAFHNSIPSGTTQCSTAPLPAGCPTLQPISGSGSGESYRYTLTFVRGSAGIRVVSEASAVADANIRARAESFVQAVGSGFPAGATMPPPWVTAGCITTAATGTPDTYVLSNGALSVISGTAATPACLPQGHLDVSLWTDHNGNGFQEASEIGSATTFNRGTFPGCPGTQCAWNHVFGVANGGMTLAQALSRATTFTNNIPCGAPTVRPSIYRINNSGPINPGDVTGSCSGVGVHTRTIGTPTTPVILIIPAAHGCPRFNGGIRIYGMVYYETTTACAAQGWGGAEIYGSVVWEGNIDRPNANSKFIEVNYENLGGGLSGAFNLTDFHTSVPGTWRDF